MQVPSVRFVSRELDYGEVFVRYPYDRDLILRNDHPDLWAKYEILPQVRLWQSLETKEPFLTHRCTLAHREIHPTCPPSPPPFSYRRS